MEEKKQTGRFPRGDCEYDGTERVRRAIPGQPVDRQPICGWVSANLSDELAAYGSVAAFEDKYEFDMSHVFGGPGAFREDVFDRIRAKNGELTGLLVDEVFFTGPDMPDRYRNIQDAIAFRKQRGRFCCVQTPGFFEQFNGVFGIENQLLYMAPYPEELNELYRRQRFEGRGRDRGAGRHEAGGAGSGDPPGVRAAARETPDLLHDAFRPEPPHRGGPCVRV